MSTRATPHQPEITPSTFAELAREQLRTVADKWTASRTQLKDGASIQQPTFEAQVRSAIDLIDRALARLGQKTGERAADTRHRLESQRADLVARVEAFESLGYDGRRTFNGVAAIDTIESVANAHAEHDHAERALAACDKIEQLAALQQARDVARVARNASVSALKALCRAAACPSIDSLPQARDFDNAAQQTRDITNAGQPMHRMLNALEQGARSSPTLARLWIVYEANETATVKARWQMYTEAHPERAQPVAVATAAE